MEDSDHEVEQQAEEGGSNKRTIRRWTQEEHQKLVALVAKQQETGQTEICWSAIARELPGRTGKQCRHRWVNSCQPFTKRGVWDLDEEHIVAQLHATHGSAWSHIASKLKGRSENSVKNHYNALFRSKYLDSKKESVLANYVKLLRDGQPQSVETYEQALEITRIYREQAISRISPGNRMLMQQAMQQPQQQLQPQAQMPQVGGDLGDASFNWQFALQDLQGEPLLVDPANSVPQAPLDDLQQQLQEASAGAWQQQAGPSSSTPSGQVGTSQQHHAPGRTMSLLGRTAMFSQMNDLSLAQGGELDLNQLLDIGAGIGLGGAGIGIGSAGDLLVGSSDALPAGALAGPSSQMGRQSCPGLPSHNSQPLADILAELGGLQPAGSTQPQQAPGHTGPQQQDAYGNWQSYSGTGGANDPLKGLSDLPLMANLMTVTSGITTTSNSVQDGTAVAAEATNANSNVLRMQEFVARSQMGLPSSGNSGPAANAAASPLLQMMQAMSAQREQLLSAVSGSVSMKDTLMGRIEEQAFLQEGGGSQGAAGSAPRTRPSRRRSYAELYADSGTPPQALAQQLLDSSRSQPGSTLAAAYGPSSATALGGASGGGVGVGGSVSGPLAGALQRNGSTGIGSAMYAGQKRPSTDMGTSGTGPYNGPLSSDPLRASHAHSTDYLVEQLPNGYAPSSAAGNAAMPQSVAWGGTRDAVYLPPGWAPAPDLNDDNDIDVNLFLAPRAPRVRRVGAAESVSGGPSPTATAAAGELPPVARASTAVITEGPTMSAAQRRRHSVAYMPSAEMNTVEVDMSDLAAYVPGQNRRRSMSVLHSSGNLPPPMHMGVSDAPQRKQRFRRRSTEAYSSGNPLSAGLLDPSLLSLLSNAAGNNSNNTGTGTNQQNAARPGASLADAFDYLGPMQVDNAMLLQASQSGVSENPSRTDAHTGLTPMVSGIDIAHRTASGVLYNTNSSGIGEPVGAVSAPATISNLQFVYANAANDAAANSVIDAAYWEKLQEVLGGLGDNSHRNGLANGPVGGASQAQLGSAGASTQLYNTAGSADLAAFERLEPSSLDVHVSHLAAIKREPSGTDGSTMPPPGIAVPTSSQPASAQISPAGSAVAARSGCGSPAPQLTDTLAATGAENSGGSGCGSVHPGASVSPAGPQGPPRTGPPMLDTTMSVSFNLGKIFSPTSDYLASPHLGALFQAGNSMDMNTNGAAAGDAVLCPLRVLGRDDNSFKERLNIGQPLSSLDVLLESNNGDGI